MYRGKEPTMTVQDLIDTLQDIAHEVGADAPVSVALQPSYPLEADIATVSIVDGRVYVATGSETGYAPRDAWAG